ncbi:MAG TPA: cyclic pyranopterin monophosphate synthase MoaC [Pirellulales bacterium]|jgi:cyclic pyranopterin phosphate synthase
MSDLTHIGPSGASRMVDVGAKPISQRIARASARVRMAEPTRRRLAERGLTKGDVLEVARIAGIMAAKRTSELIPLCHPISLDAVEIDFELVDTDQVSITAEARTQGRTGVEMEALTAASVAALTIYDMCKAIDRGMTIENIQLEAKSGGKSGDFRRSP